MDHKTAQDILHEVAPTLSSSFRQGQAHIDVFAMDGEGYRVKGPFSIMLPKSTEAVPMTPEEEQAMLIQGIQTAKAHFNAG
jgi:hypothetical protein